ncbi:50S ribosomal protein L2 [Mitosporidium daphniae]|uniref:50S ribosomal protein L2 n=1 Tax=Mitosporidium daphniae TaxID=1485682 RepID=A0A098VQA4_9MICR|nr:50S ribosomal protein L2 [Mitosporidium daphniae]KGG51170.1 50S ribosomal protein L2 [Mitosporidium daphniae]|eukprot:XP_013237597.1 50S ribosomal protein L2 [Mitosporidium daphniae]
MGIGKCLLINFGIPAIGADLAHAVGNIPLALNEWDVDFAVWCTYKYLNAGPGSIGGYYINKRHLDKDDKLPAGDAGRYLVSNPPILSLVPVKVSLQLFRDTGGIIPLRERSTKLTSYLRSLLVERIGPPTITIITPEGQCGAQLSISITVIPIDEVAKQLLLEGIVVDTRRPNVLRVAPTALYNTFVDCFLFVKALAKILCKLLSTAQTIKPALKPIIPPFLLKLSARFPEFSEPDRSLLVEKINDGSILSTLQPKQYKTILLLMKLNKKIPPHMRCKDLTLIPPAGLPPKHLTATKKRHSGRNYTGQIVVRHKGGGERHRYRLIDFKRTEAFSPLLLGVKSQPPSNTGPPIQRVVRIEKDPNRTSHIALLQREADNSLSYIVAPDGLKVGDTIKNDGTPGLGEYLPLSFIPVGSSVHNVELKPGKGPQLARSAGTRAIFEGMDLSGEKAIIIMPSKRKVLVDRNCKAAIGQVSNISWGSTPLGKAGVNRRRGIRPTVRGMAMNPVDHPHGGGKGGRNKGHHSRSPWGKIAK